jgi:hypothetical protein
LPANPVPASRRRSSEANEAKAKFLKALEAGASVKEACAAVGRVVKTYEDWRRLDPDFLRQVEIIRAVQGRTGPASAVPDFATFRKKYFHSETFAHQLQWIDVLEGGEPRELHPAQTYERGKSNRIIVNTPPEFSKSTVITVDYVTYRIVKDPNIRILLVSKNQKMAVKFLYSIKNRLSHPMYSDLIKDFAPAGGFKDTSETWTSDMIYLGQDARDDGSQKDPTVQALGMGGQIYGARADLIILDDCVILSNAHEYDKQIDWINQEVATRLGSKGALLVVGTRVSPNDLYSELRKPERYSNGASPWTYLSQPAVLEFGDDPSEWKALWPRTDRPCGCRDICNDSEEPGPDGLHPKWDGPHIADRRAQVSARTWSLVFMQQQIADDSVFPEYAVTGAVTGRQPGPLSPNTIGARRDGMEGLYVVAGLDPAMTRATAAVVMGVDRQTKMRYVLDVHNENAMTPLEIRNLIKEWTIKYGISEWRIEKNAFQLFLTQDEEINEFVRGIGCTIKEHYCVDTETEVLSKRGWLQYNDVAVGDEILTLNTASGASEWKPVKDVYRGEYSGAMHRFDSNSLDALCTPDHKWAVSQNGGPLALVPSTALNSGSVIPAARPLTDGQDPTAKYSDDFVELVGWAVTEGHYRAKGTAINVSQSEQANPEHCERIRLVLKRLRADFVERDNGSNNGVRLFPLKGEVAMAVRAVTNNSKSLPAEFITALTASQRELLLEVLRIADGWVHRGAEYFCSDSESLLQGYEMLCALQGSHTYRSYRKDDPGHGVVHRKRTPRIWMSTPGTRPKVIEQWEGTIWCPSTDNGTFYARRGGRTYFTGNTGRNRLDADFGVASMAGLFGEYKREESSMTWRQVIKPLINLPSPKHIERVKQMISQIVAWEPQTKNPHDIVMALWFAELRAREVCMQAQNTSHHMTAFDGYLSKARRNERIVVNLDDAIAAQRESERHLYVI